MDESNPATIQPLTDGDLDCLDPMSHEGTWRSFGDCTELTLTTGRVITLWDAVDLLAPEVRHWRRLEAERQQIAMDIFHDTEGK
jgi:hypothetical protein